MFQIKHVLEDGILTSTLEVVHRSRVTLPEEDAESFKKQLEARATKSLRALMYGELADAIGQNLAALYGSGPPQEARETLDRIHKILDSYLYGER